MIVCSCASLTEQDLREAIERLKQAGKKPTVNSIYRELNKQARCGNCLPLVRPLVREFGDTKT